MRLKKMVATAATVSALGFGAISGVGVANADPAAPFPAKPGPCGPHNDCWPGPGPGARGNPGNGPDWKPGQGPGNWNNNIQDLSVGSRDWWRGRPGKWWKDDDLPPWGFWGAPPPVQWTGPPPWVNPHPINYWGYNATPVWDDGFQGWGIWLFGVFIPIVGIGTF
jgi:hypothetical protein